MVIFGIGVPIYLLLPLNYDGLNTEEINIINNFH